jgi:RNA polymerase sigma-70 factor (ECF subfamily)
MSLIADQYWQKTKEGDETAFELLFKEFYASLHFYAAQIVRDTFIADEVVLDVFNKIWENKELIIIKTSLKAYLFQCIRNQSIDIIKKSRSKKTAVNATVPDQTWKFIIDTVESDDYVFEKLTASEVEQDIKQIIASLTPQCRLVFEMSRFEDKSIDEIATRFDISKNTVRSHIYNALTKISAYLHSEIKKN